MSRSRRTTRAGRLSHGATREAEDTDITTSTLSSWTPRGASAGSRPRSPRFATCPGIRGAGCFSRGTRRAPIGTWRTRCPITRSGARSTRRRRRSRSRGRVGRSDLSPNSSRTGERRSSASRSRGAHDVLGARRHAGRALHGRIRKAGGDALRFDGLLRQTPLLPGRGAYDRSESVLEIGGRGRLFDRQSPARRARRPRGGAERRAVRPRALVGSERGERLLVLRAVPRALRGFRAGGGEISSGSSTRPSTSTANGTGAPATTTSSRPST